MLRLPSQLQWKPRPRQKCRWWARLSWFQVLQRRGLVRVQTLLWVVSAVVVVVTAQDKGPLPLVTGCGRGGTHATTAMLKQLGVKCAHEGVVEGGVSVGCPFAAKVEDGEYIGFEWPPLGRYPFESVDSYNVRTKTVSKFSPVVLLVRNPIDVISSTRRCFCAKGMRNTPGRIRSDNRSWSFLERHLNLTEILGTGAWCDSE